VPLVPCRGKGALHSGRQVAQRKGASWVRRKTLRRTRPTTCLVLSERPQAHLSRRFLHLAIHGKHHDYIDPKGTASSPELPGNPRRLRRPTANRGYDPHPGCPRCVTFRTTHCQLKRETGRAVTLLTADLTIGLSWPRWEDVLKHNQSISLLLNQCGRRLRGAASQRRRWEDGRNHRPEVWRLPASLTRQRRRSWRADTVPSSTLHRPWGCRRDSQRCLGASKAFVIAFSHSLQHELAEKGAAFRRCAGRDPTDLWELAGLPYQSCRRQCHVAGRHGRCGACGTRSG